MGLLSDSVTPAYTGDVGAVDKFSYGNVGGSDRAFFQHIASYQGQEVGIGWVSCYTLEAAGAARGAELAGGEAVGVVRNYLHVILSEGNGGEPAHVVEVEPGVAWSENDEPCVAVDHKVDAIVN